MCLNIPDKIVQHYKEGYKIFSVVKDGKLYGEFFVHSYYKMNEWIIDYNRFDIRSTIGIEYKPGFHFFTSLEDAYKWLKSGRRSTRRVLKIFKVKVKDCVASGWQNPLKETVGVARAMKIVEELEG